MRNRGRRRGLGVALRSVVVAAIGTVLVLGSAGPAFACSCGAIAVPDATEATTDGSRLLLRWDGRVESIDLGLDLETAAGTVGFVFPTPARATVELGDDALLNALDEVTGPVEIVEDDWWGRRSDAPPVAVERVSRAAADLVDSQTVSAAERGALTAWLKAHELHLTKDQRDRISEYANQGWSLSMVAIDASAAVDGELDAIRFSFPTDEPVLPMRLAATGTEPTDLSVAVLSNTRTRLMQSPRVGRNINAAQTVTWAGDVSDTPLGDFGSYLTVTRLRFDAPDEQVTTDIAVVPAVADDQVIPTTVRYAPIALFGVPLGWLLVTWAGFGLLIGVGYLINRFRAK